MKRATVLVLLALMIVAIGLPAGMGAGLPEKRPAAWAQPIVMEGVPNLHRVSDILYRSAQPTAGGMRHLREIGVKTIVSLRSFHSDRDEIEDTSLGYERIAMKTWHPEEEEAIRFLRIVTNRERTPVLVHCQYGADRTGAMCAVFRVAVQRRSKEEALREMTEGGFGFHEIWANLIDWIHSLNIDKIRKEAGVR
jgi:protein tyrosine phosphatase (PTP) superfamily phosphohydrolase (DUF442 family)